MNTATPKPLFKSRTVLFNLLLLIAGLIWGEQARALLTEHTETVLALITLSNVALRCITRQAVTLIPDPPDDFFDHGGPD